MYWLLALIVVLVFLFLWLYWREPSLEELHAKTTGHVFDEKAEKLLRKTREREKTLSKPKTSREVREATENAFFLANTLNFNLAPNLPPRERKRVKEEAAGYYLTALERLLEAPPRPEPGHFGAEEILDRAEEFFEQQVLERVLRNEPPPPRPGIEGIRERVRAARPLQPPQTPQITVANDPQNVHDSEVNRGMREIWKSLQNCTPGEREAEKTLLSLLEEIEGFPFATEAQRNEVRSSVLAMSESRTTNSFGGSERELLLRTWQRVESPENAGNRQLLKESFLQAVEEGVENGYRVCTQGRCARVLGALTLLDRNPELSKPMKSKSLLRQEFLGRAGKVLEELLKELSGGEKESYLAGNKELEEKLKGRLELALRSEYSELKPSLLPELVKDAQAGV